MTNKRDTLIYFTGEHYVIADQNTRAVLHSESDAATAIQFALDGAHREGGGEVQVASGTFPLDRPLRLPGKVTLSGRGHGTVLCASRLFAGEAAVILEDACAASVRQLTISGVLGQALAGGVVLRRSAQCVLDSVAVGGTSGAGFTIADNSSLVQVRGCIAAGNARCGFLLKENFRGAHGDFIPLSVQNCLVYGGGKGFEFDRCIVANITGCSVYQTRSTAFHLYNMSNSVLISGCRTFQIGADAYVSEESNEINLTGNIFCWHEGVGVRLNKVCWGTITGNNIIDTGSFNPDAPDCSLTFAQVGERAKPTEGMVLVESRGIVVSGNTIFNWHVCPPLAHAISEDAGCCDNTYVGNNFNYLAGEPVSARGQRSTVAGNTAHAEQPHVHYYGKQTLLPPHEQHVQSFQPKLTRDLIERIFGRPHLPA